MERRKLAVYALTAFFGWQAVLAWSHAILPLPFQSQQPEYWRATLIYGGAAAYVAYLCWRQSPRARFAAYIFLTMDILRALRGIQWWTLIIDLALLGIMQMPIFRQHYPSIRPGEWRRRPARPTTSTSDASDRAPAGEGGAQSTC